MLSEAAAFVDNSAVILRFLGSIGHRSEAEFYLSLFRAESKESFALLVMDTLVLRHGLDAVVRDLSFLHGLGLEPVVCMGLYQPGPKILEHAERLQRHLLRSGVPSALLTEQEPDLARAVTSRARQGAVPIVRFVRAGLDSARRYDRLGELVSALCTRKVVFVSRRGGLRQRQAQQDLSVINLATDFDSLTIERSLPPRQLFLLEQARRMLLEHTQHRMTISFTSPLELLPELFTVRGSGTLIKRGAKIARYEGYEGVDVTRLRSLLVNSFGRPLRDDFFDRAVDTVYLDEHYRGAALVRKTALGGYLCKFAVEREAQGEGIGRDLWQWVVVDYPVLFWRARSQNPIGSWYQQECDGMNRFEGWNVYWKKVQPQRVADVIAYALSQPVDFRHPEPAA